MRISNPSMMKLGGLAISMITRQWMRTLDYQGVQYELGADPTVPGFRGPAIFLFWHEYIPFMFYLRAHSQIAMLVSRHQDAEWLSQAARYDGFETVRGSTSRGGAAVLRELLRGGKNESLAITPDGPRGPRRRLAPGCIYLSSRLGIPLVLIGLGYDRPWRIRRAWDQFAVPRPYSRARAISGPLIQIPPDLGRDRVEQYRVRIETMLNQLSTLAEQWAASGNRYLGQIPVFRRPRYRAGFTSDEFGGVPGTRGGDGESEESERLRIA